MKMKNAIFALLAVCFTIGLFLCWGCGGQSGQDPETAREIAELKAQVQNLRDVEAVKQLHIRYVNALTYANWEEVVDCFAQDAVSAVFMDREPIVGIDAIRDSFMNEIAKSDKHVGKEANLTLHPIITVDGDTAKGNWVIYFITQPDPDETPLQLVQGIYDMEYKKENGEWKIGYIKWTARFALGMAGVLPPAGGSGEGPPPGDPGAPIPPEGQ
jgi:ketosteroid isomerase-like protein